MSVRGGIGLDASWCRLDIERLFSVNSQAVKYNTLKKKNSEHEQHPDFTVVPPLIKSNVFLIFTRKSTLELISWWKFNAGWSRSEVSVQ